MREANLSSLMEHITIAHHLQRMPTMHTCSSGRYIIFFVGASQVNGSGECSDIFMSPTHLYFHHRVLKLHVCLLKLHLVEDKPEVMVEAVVEAVDEEVLQDLVASTCYCW